MPSKRPPASRPKESHSDPPPDLPALPKSPIPIHTSQKNHHKFPPPDSKKPKSFKKSSKPSSSSSTDPKPPMISSKIPQEPAPDATSKKPKPSKIPEEPPTSPSPPPRQSHRKRKPREFPDNDTSSPPFHRIFSPDDTLNLMKAVLEFRARTGAAPTLTTIPLFYDAVKSSLPNTITQNQVYNKIRTLRQNFLRDALHDTSLYNLAKETWGEHEKKADVVIEKKANVVMENIANEGEGEKGADTCLMVRSQLVESFKEKGMSGEMLERGLKLVDTARAKVLEAKWLRQCERDLKIEVKRCDLDKQFLMMLGTVYRETSSQVL